MPSISLYSAASMNTGLNLRIRPAPTPRNQPQRVRPRKPPMNDSSTQPAVNRLVVVSNRLPFVLSADADGRWALKPGSGGLVSAIAPVLRNRGGMWIGWPGSAENEIDDLENILARATKNSGYTLKPVILTTEEKEKFYHGFSNEVIWPLFHD